jgi:hypothetical protein
LEDPYGGPSIVEERSAAKAAGQREEIKEMHPELGTTAAEGDPNYEPASTWDGLVEVGGEQVEEFYFDGFMPAETVSNRYEAMAAVHRALVEVIAIKQSGRPFSSLPKINKENDKTFEVQISGVPATPLLQFKEGMSEESILQPTTREEPDREAEHLIENPVDATETAPEAKLDKSAATDGLEGRQFIDYEKQAVSWDPAWLKVSLADHRIKFAVSDI